LTKHLSYNEDIPKDNEIMAAHFNLPYPARVTFAVSGLPKGAAIEVEATLLLPDGA
jgi:enamine deaminase RidA (YjgF/YER057c/UK114 family)